MNGDFTRFIFDPDKHYIQTLMQQGRVQLDADWNEQAAIRRYHHEKTASAVIGRSGAPKIGGGFAIALASGGTNLSISPGTMYVDGLLVENRAAAPVLLTAQPFLSQRSGQLSGFDLPSTTGRYVVYLEARERHVTALQDERLLEPALGGVDTTTRLQLVWQVRLTRDPVGSTATCATFGPDWVPPEAAGGGTLTADTDPAQATDSPCVLPASAGYRGLDNALYRVEVHTGGARNAARWKWSAFNGQIATAVSVSGQVLTARDLGRDEVMRFSADQWIEIVDERTDLAYRHGTLLLVEDVNPDTREITISTTTSVPAVDSSRPVLIRRWDNPTTSTAAGLSMGAAAAHLEAGVVVSFSDSNYRAGDYWVIPARTALNGLGGHLDWPRAGNAPAALPPHGPKRCFVPLAVVDFNASTGVFTLVADGDCRAPFPPLTAIAATDVSFDPSVCAFSEANNVQEALDEICRRMNGGGCTFVVRPGTDIQALVDSLAPGADAMFCFGVGRYDLQQPVTVKNKGSIVFRGAGFGTEVVASLSESAFRFDHCASAVVRDMFVHSEKAGPSTPASAHLGGAIAFLDCPVVTVENVLARCASLSARVTSCVSVRNAAAESDAVRAAAEGAPREAALAAERRAAVAARTTCARIRGNQFIVGDGQVGILLANVGAAFVAENIVRAVPPTRRFNDLVAEIAGRAMLRTELIRNVRITNSATAVAGTNAMIPFGNAFIHFLTDPKLVENLTTNAWATLSSSLPPDPQVDKRQAKVYLRKLGNQVLGYNRTLANSNYAAFLPVLNRLAAWTNPIAAQAIVIGGRMAEEVRIENNVIEGALQGVHVGLSHPSPQKSTPDEAGTVHIVGNTITTRIGSTAVRARHGIFVGSCRSLMIDGNSMDVDRPSGNTTPVEGIRIYGNIGRRMVVRENHLRRVNTGVVAAPLLTQADESRKNLWLITDNIAEGAASIVAVSRYILDKESELGTTIIRRTYNYA